MSRLPEPTLDEVHAIKAAAAERIKAYPTGDLKMVAEALRAGKYGHVKEGSIQFQILERLAAYFESLDRSQCSCGACPGWHVGKEWDWLIQ